MQIFSFEQLSINIKTLFIFTLLIFFSSTKFDRSLSGPSSLKDSRISTTGIHMVGIHDRLIVNKNISGGLQPCITLINCYNIQILQNKLNNSTDVGIYLLNCKNIIIRGNYFTNLSSGVYVERCKDGGIEVDHCQFLNMRGPYPRGQFVQFNNVDGAGNLISNNRCENIQGHSNPEDGISLYKCNGTSKNPILVKGNWIRGGGPSRSGGGIMLGDNGGSYQVAIQNILVDPGQYGVAISGGDHNLIVKNIIYARPQIFTNVGIYVADYSKSNSSNNIVAYNKVRYHKSDGTLNNIWVQPTLPAPSGLESNIFDTKINSSALPGKLITLK